jgi:hypothetical protein
MPRIRKSALTPYYGRCRLKVAAGGLTGNASSSPSFRDLEPRDDAPTVQDQAEGLRDAQKEQAGRQEGYHVEVE